MVPIFFDSISAVVINAVRMHENHQITSGTA
jgi:hypothetical protein